MEQRLIDANALKESFRKQTVNVQEKIKEDADAIIEAICKDIDIAPTVDAVPVVRCEDCKHLGENDGYYFCNAIGIAFGNKPNWFCADGEKGADGEADNI